MWEDFSFLLLTPTSLIVPILPRVSLIITIDTAVQTASVALCDERNVLGLKLNPDQKDHAAWLHPAIQQLLQEQGRTLPEIKAIAVSAGPGSYTGLRVGMSAAKGLCYALGVPLIELNTLKIMAFAARDAREDLLCPMIDARRLEVFTAVYDAELRQELPPANMILEPTSFAGLLDTRSIFFFGNGSPKFQKMLQHPNASFGALDVNAGNMAILADEEFKNGRFANLAYAEPFYGKGFYTPPVK